MIIPVNRKSPCCWLLFACLAFRKCELMHDNASAQILRNQLLDLQYLYSVWGWFTLLLMLKISKWIWYGHTMSTLNLPCRSNQSSPAWPLLCGASPLRPHPSSCWSFVCFKLWHAAAVDHDVCLYLEQEGVCILAGLGYNGTVDDKPQWNACANMKIWLFETSPQFSGTIESFNINTNAWAARWERSR